MMQPLISVIVPCFNMGRFIDEALASVGAQNYQNWELIAVDDCGPEDGTGDSIRAFAAKYPDKRIEFIRHENNGGVSSARNTAIAHSNGEWIAFLDPDDYWLSHHLQASYEAFSRLNSIDVVASPVEAFTDANGIREVSLWAIPKLNIENFPASLTYNNFIQPSTVVLRKKLLNSVAGFDIAPEIQHIEDYDLWIRLAQTGARFTFLSAVSCCYRRHPGGATSDSIKMCHRHAALYKKHLYFFIEMQSQLLRMQASVVARGETALRGPLVRIALKVDRLFAKLENRLRVRGD